MAHRLLPPPVRRLQTELRLPLVQHPGERIARQLEASLMTRDSLRRYKTTGNRAMLGPLPALHRFVLEDVGYPNTPDSMATGLRARNAPRVADKTRGQSAGI